MHKRACISDTFGALIPCATCMDFMFDSQIWLSTRGGEVLLAAEPGVTEKYEDVKLNSRGFGILDVG